MSNKIIYVKRWMIDKLHRDFFYRQNPYIPDREWFCCQDSEHLDKMFKMSCEPLQMCKHLPGRVPLTMASLLFIDWLVCVRKGVSCVSQLELHQTSSGENCFCSSLSCPGKIIYWKSSLCYFKHPFLSYSMNAHVLSEKSGFSSSFTASWQKLLYVFIFRVKTQ